MQCTRLASRTIFRTSTRYLHPRDPRNKLHPRDPRRQMHPKDPRLGQMTKEEKKEEESEYDRYNKALGDAASEVLQSYDDPEKLNAEELKKFNNEMNENINETRKNFILESQKSKENDPTYKVVERFDD